MLQTGHVIVVDVVIVIAIPKPSSKLKAKLGMALLSVLVSSYSSSTAEPIWTRCIQARPGASKPDQGLSRQNSGFQAKGT